MIARIATGEKDITPDDGKMIDAANPVPAVRSPYKRDAAEFQTETLPIFRQVSPAGEVVSQFEISSKYLIGDHE